MRQPSDGDQIYSDLIRGKDPEAPSVLTNSETQVEYLSGAATNEVKDRVLSALARSAKARQDFAETGSELDRLRLLPVDELGDIESPIARAWRSLIQDRVLAAADCRSSRHPILSSALGAKVRSGDVSAQAAWTQLLAACEAISIERRQAGRPATHRLAISAAKPRLVGIDGDKLVATLSQESGTLSLTVVTPAGSILELGLIGGETVLRIAAFSATPEPQAIPLPWLLEASSAFGVAPTLGDIQLSHKPNEGQDSLPILIQERRFVHFEEPPTLREGHLEMRLGAGEACLLADAGDRLAIEFAVNLGSHAAWQRIGTVVMSDLRREGATFHVRILGHGRDCCFSSPVRVTMLSRRS
jgi:hypothetical protein